MNKSTFHGYVGFIRSCILGAKDAWRRREFRMAEELRKSAREALDELDRRIEAAAPVDPEVAKKREIARAYAATIQQGFGRP